ncbi:hypothetical protein [Aeromicrobium sp. Sec7.5]|uniref:hypothetical protein n=1 Tax=Aeromicrobium sp. Sec7.5 TaxID=3121276 RepID=UPI002FE44907
MPSSRVRVAGAALVPVLLLTACSAGRAATEDVESGLTASGSHFPVAEQQAACAAKILVASDLSDEDLQVVADADPKAELSADAASILAKAQVKVLQDCAV